jgi:hypothetical protein
MDGRRARNVLGVDVDAGPDEIRRAFRARALLTHPDRGGDRGAFAETVDAFDALRSVPVAHVAALALPRPGPRVDVYDSPSRPRPTRNFADALRAATLRQWNTGS